MALDTEADSLHAYPEKLCLIQITGPTGDFLIDPLARLDLAALWPELKRGSLILHGADYDLRLMRKNHSFVPEKIFDTMLASRLWATARFGLTHLVKKYLDVTLEKGSQKADWARRPLTPRMEAYARNDTHYLKPMADLLRSQLEAAGRLSWLEESCRKLIAECSKLTAPDPQNVWRIKGSHKLTRSALAVLREVWHWREKEALACNRPPYFVLSHEALVEVAAGAAGNQPVDKFFPRNFSDRRREGIAQAIQAGLSAPPEKHPDLRQSRSRRQTDAGDGNSITSSSDAIK